MAVEHKDLRDLLDISETLRERDVALRSLTDHIDTGTAAGRMLYAVLGAVAQFERDVLRERTVAGMRAAKRRGEHIGRPLALTKAQVREAKTMLDRGESPAHIARVFRVGDKVMQLKNDYDRSVWNGGHAWRKRRGVSVAGTGSDVGSISDQECPLCLSARRDVQSQFL